jgi:hypothetical protein
VPSSEVWHPNSHFRLLVASIPTFFPNRWINAPRLACRRAILLYMQRYAICDLRSAIRYLPQPSTLSIGSSVPSSIEGSTTPHGLFPALKIVSCVRLPAWVSSLYRSCIDASYGHVSVEVWSGRMPVLCIRSYSSTPVHCFIFMVFIFAFGDSLANVKLGSVEWRDV